ncbi:cytochrome P450 [Nocardia sp. NBC_00565]|uniref:cytochrome P450 n=1 Tax=Nocardia sp. NBC_00565 TaxID=2975993 RepID=UPI002E818CAE|nr:cytochrome P450 [Nocardia sp. NBC_00565]WUC03399.1 cytochrome P450 [Nocardia sp. NBC_00565]
MVNNFQNVDFFLSDELVVDPYPYFDALRAQCPVLREEHHDVVMVTGYDEALEVYNDPETFSSCLSVSGPFPGFPVPLEGDDVSGLIEQHRDSLPLSDQLPTLDPPTHTDHRALLMRLITPKRLKENEDAMWTIADRVLDGYLASGEGDVVGEFAGPFTLYVIADLLGVPAADQEEFLDALQRNPHSAGAGVGSTEGEAIAHNPLEFLYGKFSTYIEDRRREPRGDVLTSMAAATFPDGSQPSVLDVVRVAANLFSAGQETTVRLLGTALKIIAERPDIQQLLRAEPNRIPNFIEEVLRTESPVKGDFRLSRVPTTVGEVDLPAGSTVMVVNGAANRDPRRFEDPATFDPARSNARSHIAFGRGIHTCPGAPLARAEARVAIERLFGRTTDIRISERVHGPADARSYQYMPTFILRGLMELHLEFTLAPSEA